MIIGTANTGSMWRSKQMCRQSDALHVPDVNLSLHCRLSLSGSGCAVHKTTSVKAVCNGMPGLSEIEFGCEVKSGAPYKQWRGVKHCLHLGVEAQPQRPAGTAAGG